MYCGGALPEPTAPTPTPANVPEDIDALVRQAMTLGTTHKLQAAMVAHRAESGGPEDEAPVEAMGSDELLDALVEAARSAQEAHRNNDERRRDEALLHVESLVRDWGPIGPTVTAPKAVPPTPEVSLPRYRRSFALVLEGPGDGGLAPVIANAIEVDGVTARMIAIARQPRIVLRSEEPGRLQGMAESLRDRMGIAAAVVAPDLLTAPGPAELLVGFAHGPETAVVHDWTVDLTNANPQSKMTESPFLAVPGEVLMMKARAVRGGGRLKHLREGKTSTATERRITVLDLHTPSGIVRLVEGVTDLTDSPAASEGTFRSSMRLMLEEWEAAGVKVLEARTVSPSGQAVGNRVEEGGACLTTSWPEWEEYSRSCRVLFSDLDSALQSPAEDSDLQQGDPR